jgi:hypothetical protein
LKSEIPNDLPLIGQALMTPCDFNLGIRVAFWSAAVSRAIERACLFVQKSNRLDKASAPQKSIYCVMQMIGGGRNDEHASRFGGDINCTPRTEIAL